MQKCTFIIAEESYLIRKGLISIIEKIPNSKIISQIDSVEDLQKLRNLESDFLILNPNLINSENKSLIIEVSPTCKLISCSVSQSEISEDLEWIEHIELNDSQNTILKKINKLIGSCGAVLEEAPEEIISSREADILKHIALGYSNKEIADKLFISAHTVVTHRKNITRKLGIKTVPGLTIYAILNKLIEINDTE